MDAQHQLGTAARPLRVAVVGAGPAGFYAVEALLKQKDLVCSIDIFNHFPTPFGLVREGVAPDHQSIKTVTRVYDKLMDNPNVHYFGNVTFGSDITYADLAALYDQVVYAVGAQSDRHMGIPGEDLAGSLPATMFVGWYNGHPDYVNLNPNLDTERVAVVGIGNVAVDVARILLKDPDELAKTDIADYALDALRHSQVREVVMLGRRGPAQAAFTNVELKELGELKDVDVVVDPGDLELDEDSAASLAKDRVAKRNVEILRDFALRQPTGAPRRLFLRFLVSPVEVLGRQGHVSGLTIERNRLVKDAYGGLRARGTGHYETLDVGMVLRSVGYRSMPLAALPFDEMSYTMMNVAGRVIRPQESIPIPGQYCVGWVKRGPSGVIGTNKPDAVATVAAMVEDLPSLPGVPDENRAPSKIEDLLRERGVAFVSWADWKVLDRYEVAQGAAQGRPRVKVCTVPEMLEIIRQGPQT